MPAARSRNLGRLARIAVGAFMLAPIAWAAWASLQPLASVLSERPSAAPLQFDNYAHVVTRQPMTRFLLNSAVISAAVAIGNVLTGSMTAFALTRLRWRGRSLATGVVLATLVMPSQLLFVAQFLVYRELGWVGTYKPLIVPAWLGGSALSILLYRQVFAGISRDHEDAARLDGADDWQVYWRILLPMARPVTAVVATFAALGAWQAFLDPLVYLTDYQTFPVSVGLRMLNAVDGTRANWVLAACILAMLPPALCIGLTQHLLMREVGAEAPVSNQSLVAPVSNRSNPTQPNPSSSTGAQTISLNGERPVRKQTESDLKTQVSRLSPQAASRKPHSHPTARSTAFHCGVYASPRSTIR